MNSENPNLAIVMNFSRNFKFRLIKQAFSENPCFDIVIPSYVPSVCTLAVMQIAANMELNVSNLG